MNYEPGIGLTHELNLRVSVATLVRVIFKHPINDDSILALERKATLYEMDYGRVVEVKSQPFGGAIRILDLNAVLDLIGDFHFDSERSRAEQDFRLLIRPSSWSVLRAFCIQHLSHKDDPILETDPTRELVEEFSDTLKINLQPGQYISQPVATVVENKAAPTENIHTKGILTVRVFRIFEAYITDSSLAYTMMENSESLSDQDLRELALVDVKNGGKGRANAMLVLPLKHLTDIYSSMTPKARNLPILFEKHRLDETIPAMLEGVVVPKYQRL
jgi:hypothetical protein